MAYQPSWVMDRAKSRKGKKEEKRKTEREMYRHGKKKRGSERSKLSLKKIKFNLLLFL